MSRGASMLVHLIAKEFSLEARSKEIIATMAVFSILLVILFSFAFYTDAERAQVYAPGILWITVLFSGTLGLNRLFDKEMEAGALESLLLGASHVRLVFLSKAIVHFILTMGVVCLTLPTLVLFFRLEVVQPGLLLASLGLGTLGFSFLGTLFASTLCYARMKDVLLPLIVYPLAVPVLVAGVKSSGGILQELPVDEVHAWMLFMVGYDILFVCASTYLYAPLSKQ